MLHTARCCGAVQPPAPAHCHRAAHSMYPLRWCLVKGIITYRFGKFSAPQYHQKDSITHSSAPGTSSEAKALTGIAEAMTGTALSLHDHGPSPSYGLGQPQHSSNLSGAWAAADSNSPFRIRTGFSTGRIPMAFWHVTRPGGTEEQGHTPTHTRTAARSTEGAGLGEHLNTSRGGCDWPEGRTMWEQRIGGEQLSLCGDWLAAGLWAPWLGRHPRPTGRPMGQPSGVSLAPG